jgi:hypothetical protein
MTTQPRSNTLIRYRIRPRAWTDVNLADAVQQILDGSEYWDGPDRDAITEEALRRWLESVQP